MKRENEREKAAERVAGLTSWYLEHFLSVARDTR